MYVVEVLPLVFLLGEMFGFGGKFDINIYDLLIFVEDSWILRRLRAMLCVC